MKILIVVPAYNEEEIIKEKLLILDKYLQDNLTAYEYKIVLADNMSTDQTAQIVKDLVNRLDDLEYLYIEPTKSKGAAVLKPWQKYQNDFDIFSFMDADLATDLSAFLPLIQSIAEGYDLAIGCRYHKNSQVNRSLKRKLFSQAYSNLVKIILNTKIKDFPCGFKAVNQAVVKKIVPRIKNQTWFFDTELVYLAQQAGLKIKEIPVKWFEPRASDSQSRVNTWQVLKEYLKELWRLRFKK